MSPRRSLFPSPFASALALVLAAAPSLLAQVEPIMPPAKRVEALEKARGLLAAKPAPATQVNPFFSETFNEVRMGGAPVSTVPGEAAPAVSTPVGPKSNRDLLQAIATSLKPRYLEMSGQSMLFFGQKRVKAGGLLTVTFEGNEYTVEVAAIDRTNFTLRLNREEFTRPIK